ncbi:hypothetical protein FHG87_017377 [Trinorchestia longiramus]|nr:hypothetical protein FHG87_017377 [Trinorchestia longiramus]
MEKNQRKATKMILAFRNHSYERRLQQFECISLEQRRLRRQLINSHVQPIKISTAWDLGSSPRMDQTSFLLPHSILWLGLRVSLPCPEREAWRNLVCPGVEQTCTHVVACLSSLTVNTELPF